MYIFKLFELRRIDTKIQVFEKMTYEEFHNRFHHSLFPGVSLKSLIRANRYKRAFVSPVIRPGDFVLIPPFKY
jgi:hypothetical protein